MTEDKYSLHDNNNILRAKADRDYLGELLIHNEDLIWYTIRKYIGDPYKLAAYNGMEKEDIQQVGRIGFIKAVDNFDSERGISFTTYAPSVISGEVKTYLREKGRLIRLTRSAYDLNTKVLGYLEDKCYDNYIPASMIAEELGVEEEEVMKLLSVGATPFRISPPRHNQNENNVNLANNMVSIPLIDEITDIENETLEKIYLDQLLEIVRSKLNERDKRILDAKLKGITHEQVAKEEDIAKITVTRTMNKIRGIIKDILDE